MTEYLVLQSVPAHPALSSDEDEVGFSVSDGPGWRSIKKVEARSADAAIRAVLNGYTGEGMFVAVPARSWKPVTVKVETKTALRFS